MIFKPLPGMLFLKSQSLEIRLTLQLKKQMCKNRRIYIFYDLYFVICNLISWIILDREPVCVEVTIDKVTTYAVNIDDPIEKDF